MRLVTCMYNNKYESNQSIHLGPNSQLSGDWELTQMEDKTRDLFQPAWLIRCLIHRLDQFPASSSHQHL